VGAGELVNVNSVIVAFDTLIGVLRTVLFAGGVVVAALAALSYAVRTRRINPFSPVARLARSSVDPLFAPVERRVLRFGGRPATAPWWALAALLVLGIVVISALGFVRTQIATAMIAVSTGGSSLVRLLVGWTFGVLQIALLARVAASWFQVSPYARWLRWAYALTEWLLRPLRQIVPPVGMMDLTPIVAYVVLRVLEWLVGGLLP
jgi:YggT family protein